MKKELSLIFVFVGIMNFRHLTIFHKQPTPVSGWPSFRDQEVNWDYVRCLRDGECVSVSGTHLGHNLPDGSGNRYCINLVSVAGEPDDDEN